MVEVDSGIDLFALEKLIPTLTDWFVTCHPSVPAVCTLSQYCRPMSGWRPLVPRDPV
jgi:hypothetical protein